MLSNIDAVKVTVSCHTGVHLERSANTLVNNIVTHQARHKAKGLHFTTPKNNSQLDVTLTEKQKKKTNNKNAG